MKRTKENTNAEERGLIFAVCWFFGFKSLDWILSNVFLLAFPLSMSIAAGAVGILLFPLFVQGKENGWTKDKREWSFLAWLTVTLTLSLVSFSLGLLVKKFYVS
jgi:hypothetical protein